MDGLDPDSPIEVSDEEEVDDVLDTSPTEALADTLLAIVEDLLGRANAPSPHPGVVADLSRLFNMKTIDREEITEELKLAYPEPTELRFLSPEPLSNAEAHLRASKSSFDLKADAALVKVADMLALTARPLADAMSYVAETRTALDPKILVDRLADVAKLLIFSAKLTKTVRVEFACRASEVPVSAAGPERGLSLLGSSFTENVELLRKDKGTLVGEKPSASGHRRQALSPYNRNTDPAPSHQAARRQPHTNSAWEPLNTSRPPTNQASATMTSSVSYENHQSPQAVTNCRKIPVRCSRSYGRWSRGRGRVRVG